MVPSSGKKAPKDCRAKPVTIAAPDDEEKDHCCDARSVRRRNIRSFMSAKNIGSRISIMNI
jgi:hypothetical protein